MNQQESTWPSKIHPWFWIVTHTVLSLRVQGSEHVFCLLFPCSALPLFLRPTVDHRRMSYGPLAKYVIFHPRRPLGLLTVLWERRDRGITPHVWFQLLLTVEDKALAVKSGKCENSARSSKFRNNCHHTCVYLNIDGNYSKHIWKTDSFLSLKDLVSMTISVAEMNPRHRDHRHGHWER